LDPKPSVEEVKNIRRNRQRMKRRREKKEKRAQEKALLLRRINYLSFNSVIRR